MTAREQAGYGETQLVAFTENDFAAAIQNVPDDPAGVSRRVRLEFGYG